MAFNGVNQKKSDKGFKWNVFRNVEILMKHFENLMFKWSIKTIFWDLKSNLS